MMELRFMPVGQNSVSPSPLPCTHTINTTHPFDQNIDTPIKHLRIRNNSTNNNLVDRLFPTQARPCTTYHTNFPSPKYDNNLNHNAQIQDLKAQLETQRTINKSQTDRITLLTNENLSLRSKVNYLNSELEGVRLTMEKEVEGLKREIEQLRREKGSLEKGRFSSNGSEVLEKTMRNQSSHEMKLEVTTVRRNFKDQRGNSNQTMNQNRNGTFVGIVGLRKRSDSVQNCAPLKKQISSIILERKNLPAHYPPKHLQPRKALQPTLHPPNPQTHPNHHIPT